MFWLCCIIVAWLFRPRRNVDIYINCKPVWYNGLTPQQYQDKLLTELYPELRYEILLQKFQAGEITKEEYEKALKNITDHIDINL